MKSLLLLSLLSLSGCGIPTAVGVSLAGSAIGYVASVNNLGASYLRWTDDQDLVCPVALEPMQRCPVKAVRAP